jgi:thiol-disulfide isomerase/thioredoxin
MRIVLCALFVAGAGAARAETAPRSAADLEAASWQARAELKRGDLEAALRDARALRADVAALLAHRRLDDDTQLPIALGAAIEVEAQALAGRGQRAQALELLRADRARYAHTSIATRIQKNLHLLDLEGKPAPALAREPHFGRAVPSLAALAAAHQPVLLFFWAHWCGDCEAMAPTIGRIASELGPRGLVVIAPTQTYGAVRGEESPRDPELRYIDQIRRQAYASLGDAPVPLDNGNFERWGASTTPTVVLVDRTGKVALYHPGAMTYDELAPRAAALFVARVTPSR